MTEIIDRNGPDLSKLPFGGEGYVPVDDPWGCETQYHHIKRRLDNMPKEGGFGAESNPRNLKEDISSGKLEIGKNATYLGSAALGSARIQ